MPRVLRDAAVVYYGKSPTDVLDRDGSVPVIGTGGVYGRANRGLFSGPAVVVPRKGSLGNPQFINCSFWPSDTTYAVIPKHEIDAQWLYYSLDCFDLTKLNEATGVPSISRDWLYKMPLGDADFTGQQRIAEILSTVDEAIDQTEALIAKTQQIKAGLMHDLFTRGVKPDGQLRPPREDTPHLYKESPLGWIPKEWSYEDLATVAESLIDGPFGSNLKSEHYVDSGGVRVVRLQNILEGEYNDRDRAFISKEHAKYLIKHTVVTADILIAALGEDNYPVGRSCCYPKDLAPAINKADCFRLRCLPSLAVNSFVMNFLNTSTARVQIRRFEQGVTRKRINLGNLRKVFVTLPSIQEQSSIVGQLEACNAQIECLTVKQEKHIQIKQGLMHDLLSDQVMVSA